jgi:urease accessory protein
MAMDLLGLTRLLQLSSPTLPVGAYSYSQGMEAAIESGIVVDADSAAAWIRDVLRFGIGSFEAPLLWRMSTAMQDDDYAALARWNTFFCAGRETAELRAETLQMGQALRVLIDDLPLFDKSDIKKLRAAESLTYPAAFSFAAHHMGVEKSAALLAYMWSWLENQVMAALKAVPLGQSAGQRMLVAIGTELPAMAHAAAQLDDDELSNFAPGLAILSSNHETQYSRIFRS